MLLVGCGRLSFEPLDSGASGDGDASGVAINELPYATIALGWSATVYVDFSSMFTYVAADFVDGAETYDNAPDAMFVLDAPYPRVLCVAAGRDLLEVSPSGVVNHDFGSHAPNTANSPDHIRSGVWTSNLGAGGNPQVFITSSSDSGGDGSYRISTQWASVDDRVINNMRAVAWDPSGGFDARGTPEAYFGTAPGVFRRSDSVMLFAGDTKTMRVVGSSMFLTRTITVDVDVRLLRVDSFTAGMYPETQVAQAAFIELGEGDPPKGFGGADPLAWVIIDSRRLALIDATSVRDTIASHTDPNIVWTAAAAPPAGHPLAPVQGTVYVLEANRQTQQVRVFALTPP